MCISNTYKANFVGHWEYCTLHRDYSVCKTTINSMKITLVIHTGDMFSFIFNCIFMLLLICLFFGCWSYWIYPFSLSNVWLYAHIHIPHTSPIESMLQCSVLFVVSVSPSSVIHFPELCPLKCQREPVSCPVT